MALIRSFWPYIGLIAVSACVWTVLLDGTGIDPKSEQNPVTHRELEASQQLSQDSSSLSDDGRTRGSGNYLSSESATNTSNSSLQWTTSVVGLLLLGAGVPSSASKGTADAAAGAAQQVPRPIRRIHVHVVAIGDSLAFGVSAKNLRYPNPYAPMVAHTIAQQLRFSVQALGRESGGGGLGRGGAGVLWANTTTKVSHSSEVHAFPGFHSKKLIFALRKLEKTNLTLYLANRAAALQQRPSSPLAQGSANTTGAPNGALPFEDWFSAGGSGDGVAATVAAANAAVNDDDTAQLATEEQSEDIIGGKRLEGAGGRPAGSPPTKKGGAQGYSKQMQQSEGINDKDLVELSYDSFFRRFAQRTVDAERLAMGLGTPAGSGGGDGTNRTTTTAQAPPPVDVLIVFCTVFTGINDAILGIPWWWVKSNLHKLHDACRKKVEDSVTASVRTMAVPPRAVVVVSVPLRMLPPYYFVQEGNTAQTQRRAKRVLDPQGFCEFYFRSPRRKLNLYHSMDMMPWVGLSPKYAHARLMESIDVDGPSKKHRGDGLLLWNPTGMSNRWCRRPTSCHGLPVAADHSGTAEARRAVSPNTNSCKFLSSASSAAQQKGQSTALCFLQRTMVPIDKHFVFPDKLSSSALWRLVLARWDDCIHPSPYGYRTMSEFLAGALHRDAEKLLRIMTSAVE